jgi:hypothetical protein
LPADRPLPSADRRFLLPDKIIVSGSNVILSAGKLLLSAGKVYLSGVTIGLFTGKGSLSADIVAVSGDTSSDDHHFYSRDGVLEWFRV